ncbi:UNVERIFIED_ORG: glutathionylspermidine synthase [Anoxybacillus amylolyticus]
MTVFMILGRGGRRSLPCFVFKGDGGVVLRMKQNVTYLKRWALLHQKAKESGFGWGMLEEEDGWHQYMGIDVLLFSQKQWDRIRLATERIGRIYQKMYEFLMSEEGVLWFGRLSLPVATWDVTKVRSSLFSYITRFDLVVDGETIKLLEGNTDTPTGIVESSVVNRLLCDYHQKRSPNRIAEGLRRAWKRWLNEMMVPSWKTIYFTSYGWHEEDRETTKFIQKCCPHPQTRYIPIEDIVVSEEGVYTKEGSPIEYLYRLYPLEFLESDYAETGEPVGKWMLNHISNQTVKMLNPPSAYMMQSKAVMALIWEMYEERHPIWTTEEREWIGMYFLPTYQTNLFCDSSYVVKPVLGREGGGVQIFNQNGEIVEQDEEMWYSEYSKVYQQYIEMPETTIETWDGPYRGKLLVGSFLLGGEPSGLFLRVGEKITGNLSMFVGVAVE